MKDHEHHDQEHHDHHDHTEHHRQMIRDFRRRFWVSLVLTVPVLLLSPMIQGWLGVDWSIPYQGYIQMALSTVLFFYGGYPFLKGMVDELKGKEPGMMTLIGLAIIVAYIYSSAVVLGLEGKTFFWELATLIDVMLAGHWVEMASVLSASRSVEKLQELIPREAHRIEDGEVRSVSIEEVEEEDLLQVKPGERIPADGVIEKGESEVDESMLTGESKPVVKSEGDELIAGSVNGGGALQLRVKNIGEHSYLQKVVRLVEDAQARKSKTQRLADRAALWLTIIAISAGTITFGVWFWGMDKDLAFSLERMVTVMVICCPHALGLAIPLVAANSTSLAAENGLLIRNRTAFENSRKLDMLVFDKTGTLTTGAFRLNRHGSLNEDWSGEQVLKWAASVEQSSEHPLAQGILSAAEEEGLELLEANDFTSITGKGVQATVEERKTGIVSPSYLEEAGIDFTPPDSEEAAETVVYLTVDEQAVGWIALADEIREESYEAMERLREKEIRAVMLTGDNEQVAAEVAGKLKIKEYLADVLPDQKQKEIERFQQEGHFVGMTGDGINDAPGLAQADIGIAVGSGTDVAAETADIILASSKPTDVVGLVDFGQATHRKMVQNLFWATAYNAVALPLAAGVLYQQGILISPAVGAALMSLSTVVVAINAQLLKF